MTTNICISIRTSKPTRSVNTMVVTWCIWQAMYLSRRFHAGVFDELPQAVAQHNLLFGALLTATLAEPVFVARVMLGCLFSLGGFNNLLVWEYNRELVHMKLTNVFPSLPTWVSTICFGCATAGQTAASMAFMLGVYPVVMARLLLAFLIPVTIVVHDIWTIEKETPVQTLTARAKSTSFERSPASRHLPNFPTEFDNEFVHFFKNVGMIGGLAIYLELQPDSDIFS